MAQAEIPSATWAVIGGSATQGCSFPEDAESGAAILKTGLQFETPYGQSPPFTLFESRAGRRCLTVRLHGWRRGVSRGKAASQVFWVLAKAGVKRIFSDAGVGSLNRLLDPRDIVVPDDFVDLTTHRSPEPVVGGNLLIMRKPVCPVMAKELAAAARRRAGGRVFDRGTCVVTEGPRFESAAEIRIMQSYGDIIGQSMCPEVWLARDIGACYAALYVVVNYAEGIVREWDHSLLKEIFERDAGRHAKMIMEALDQVDEEAHCRCGELRKPSIL